MNHFAGRLNPQSQTHSPQRWESILGRSGLARAAPLVSLDQRQSQVTAVTRSLDLGYNPWRSQGKSCSPCGIAVPCSSQKIWHTINCPKGRQYFNRTWCPEGTELTAPELPFAGGNSSLFAVKNPYKKGGGERGLAILSRFPISQVERIPLPHAGPGGRRRIALGTTVQLGPRSLRVYSIHLETRIPNGKHTDQLTTVLTDANRHGDLPTIILGDFNTVYFRTKQTFALLAAADFKTRPYEGASFRKVLFLRKKLDCIWTRNLEILESGLQEKVEASDHRPVWAQRQWGPLADEVSRSRGEKEARPVDPPSLLLRACGIVPLFEDYKI